tara:strand:- start:253 stop:1035 length:783 start_codon:yes stop_codon:yes gene_type:complete
MRNSITINIPEPCQEDWNKMTPKDQGRHCAACSKTVVDFTKQTDEHIIKTFEAKENLCGRFKTQQLDREIVLARKGKNSYLSLAASGMLAFLTFGNQDIYAQGEPRPIRTDTIINPMVKGKIATSVINEYKIYGVVTDSENAYPLPLVNVHIKGTEKGTTTDFDGNYSIKVKKGDTLIFSYLGFDSQEVTINNIKNIDITFSNSDIEILGEVVVGGIYSSTKKIRNQSKLKKRKAIKNGDQDRTAFGKFFYRIKRLFSKK